MIYVCYFWILLFNPEPRNKSSQFQPLRFAKDYVNNKSIRNTSGSAKQSY